jgi:hypothetical protein
MNRTLAALGYAFSLLLFSAPGASAATRYVNLNNPAPIAPYTDWSTAAANIQDAVDAALAGDAVLVTNGVYQTGGRLVHGATTNRVAVVLPLTIQSVNGPAVTTISGSPGMRCVYLTNGAALTGFTLTNGSTVGTGDFVTERSGGGIWCESSTSVVSNCVLVGNSANTYGAGAYQGTLNNCVLNGNSGHWGGGACQSMLNGCVLTGNLANGQFGPFGGDPYYGAGGGAFKSTLRNCILNSNAGGDSGGGAYLSTLDNCTLTNNSIGSNGGGTYGGTLNNCTLSGNSAYSGGGAAYGTLTNCILTGNSASIYGGGTFSSTLNQCTLSGNSAGYGGGASFGTLNGCGVTGNSADYGGGVMAATVNNCTLVGNRAALSGGGADGSYAGQCTLNNCIVYFNQAPQGPNFDRGSILNYCCTTPEPVDGTANFTSDPQLTSPAHLSTSSPCRGSGSAAFTTGTDIDGESWLNPPSVGCDEYNSGSVTGALSLTVTAAYTNVAVGFSVNLTSMISGLASSSTWDFGDSVMATNQVFVSHAWTAAGDYPVTFTAYNQSNPGGISGTILVHVVVQPVVYVASGNSSPGAPYTSWATAATNIQAAVDSALVPGSLVLVSNGVYQTDVRIAGGQSSRVVVSLPLTLLGVNGPAVTTIRGGSGIRCVYLATGARLSGFTITNGVAQLGGGVFCQSLNADLSNCVVSANSANFDGGGVYSGTLNNCTLTANTSAYEGGGTYLSLVNNCTFDANSAYYGGGAASGGTLNNCLIRSNSVYGADEAPMEGGGAFSAALNNCVLLGNFAPSGEGGGASSCALNNCTVCGNSAPFYGGGGIINGVMNNCIVYYNSPDNFESAYNNYYAGAWSHGCSTPLPPGPGNFTNAPMFVALVSGNLHLQTNSPCINAGNNAYAPLATDLDGNPRIRGGTVDVGAYEFPIPTIHYVDINGLTPTPPYTNWATAAANIQDAVDAALAGDLVLVTNGVYQTGSRITADNASNRVVVTTPLSIQSVNGSVATIIDGGGLVRCAYLASNCVLSGFTLRGGHTPVSRDGGGVLCQSTNVFIANCTITNSLAGFHGGGAFSGTLSNCTLIGNAAGEGGGADSSVLINCALTANSTFYSYGGGGAAYCTLNGCTLTANTTSDYGGGAMGGTLNNCLLSGNSVTNPPYKATIGGGGACAAILNNCTLNSNSAPGGAGGGAFQGVLNNCILKGNSAGYWGGGGAYSATLNNCQVTGNSVLQGYGGGVSSSTLNNCTVSGNTADYGGGGADYCTLNNSIVYFNSSPTPDQTSSTCNYCCTTPLPPGPGNFTSAPLFVAPVLGNWHLQTNSPCINAGNNAYATLTTDLDGNPRIVSGTVDVGAYEFQSLVAGSLLVITNQPQSQTVTLGNSAAFAVGAGGSAPLIYQWLFNGAAISGATLSSLSFASAQFTNGGSYSVVVSNAYASVVSSNALLTVTAVPTITNQPHNVTVVVGNSASFSASVVGSSPLSYQWQFNGAPVPGATSSVLSFGSTQVTNAGTYLLLVTNVYGSAISSNAVLTVLTPPPTISSQPQGKTVPVGWPVALSVGASGPGLLTYQWQLGGSPVPGATGPALNFAQAQLTNAGDYRVVVGNPYGAATSSIATVVVTNPVCVPSPGNLISWWQGQGDGGDTIGANLGTLQGGVGFAPGEVDQAFSFDGASGTVLVPDSASLRLTSQLTLEAWINTRATNASHPDQAILSKVGGLGGNNGYQLVLSANKLTGQFNSPGQFWPSAQISAALPLVPGTWNHVAWTYDQSAMKLYFNGQLVATSVIGAKVINTSISNLRVSGDDNNHAYFDGLIDEAAVYNRALSAAEIAAIYNALQAGKCLSATPPVITAQPQSQTVYATTAASLQVAVAGPRPMSYQWRFNGAPLAGATNSTLNFASIQPTNTGTYTVAVTNLYGAVLSSNATLTVNVAVCDPPPAGVVSWWRAEGDAQDLYGLNHGVLNGAGFSPGKVGAGFVLGTSQYLLVSNSPSLNLAGSLTLEAWIRTTANLGAQVIFGKWGDLGDYANQRSYLFQVLSGGVLDFSLASAGQTGGSGYREIDTTNNAVPPNTWVHVAGVYDGGTGVLRLYVNGAEVVAQAGPPITIWSGPAQAGIGARLTSSSQRTDFFKGSIDELALYNRALSAGEISALYHADLAGKCVPGAPTITDQPQSQSVNVGDPVLLTVTAAGTAPLSYQWQFNGAPMAGATTTAVSLGSAQLTNAGSYRVVVSNAWGVITSSNALLSVAAPPPAFGSVGLAPGGGLRLVLSGPAGDVFRLLASTNLVDWQTVATLTNTTGTVEFVDGPPGSFNQRFYRLARP